MPKPIKLVEDTNAPNYTRELTADPIFSINLQKPESGKILDHETFQHELE